MEYLVLIMSYFILGTGFLYALQRIGNHFLNKTSEKTSNEKKSSNQISYKLRKIKLKKLHNNHGEFVFDYKYDKSLSLKEIKRDISQLLYNDNFYLNKLYNSKFKKQIIVKYPNGNPKVIIDKYKFYIKKIQIFYHTGILMYEFEDFYNKYLFLIKYNINGEPYSDILFPVEKIKFSEDSNGFTYFIHYHLIALYSLLETEKLDYLIENKNKITEISTKEKMKAFKYVPTVIPQEKKISKVYKTFTNKILHKKKPIKDNGEIKDNIYKQTNNFRSTYKSRNKQEILKGKNAFKK